MRAVLIACLLLLGACDSSGTTGDFGFKCDITFKREAPGQDGWWEEVDPARLIIHRTNNLNLMSGSDYVKLYDWLEIRGRIHDVENELLIFDPKVPKHRIFTFNKFSGRGMFAMHIDNSTTDYYMMKNCVPKEKVIP